MKSSAVIKTDYQIDLKKLREAVQAVLLKYPLTETSRQIGLTSTKQQNQSVYDGAGLIYDRENSKWLAHEKDFKYFINEFAKTYLEEVYLEFQKHTENKIARMRLLLLPPRTCYSFHFDKTKRYHISLETNEHAFLVFRDEAPIHIPADGFAYLADTREWHTAVNSGNTARLHLVISLANDQADDELHDQKMAQQHR